MLLDAGAGLLMVLPALPTAIGGTATGAGCEIEPVATGSGGGPTETGETGETFTSLKLCETLTAVLPDFWVQSGMCVTVGRCGEG